jgi:peptidyl-prolyl cis-trans isomerase C
MFLFSRSFHLNKGSSMQRKITPIAVAITLALGAGPAFAQDAAKKAAAVPAAAAGAKAVVVNGVTIPKSRFDALAAEAAQGGRAPAGAELNQMIKEELVNREVLMQAATRKGLDKKPEVMTQLDLARQDVLVRALFDDHVKANPTSEASLKQQYEELKKQMGDNEYKARHVLVEKEDEAKAVAADLAKGGDFNKIAKDKSKDTGSKDNGGDLDWGPAGRYVKPFGDALKGLKKGETSAPVQTNFGWHVIRLDDVRPMKHPAFDELKPQFQQRAQQETIQKLVMDLRSKAKVEER